MTRSESFGIENYYHQEMTLRSRQKYFTVFIFILLTTDIELSLSSCSPPFTIENGTIELLPNFKANSNGKFPENSEARVYCFTGFRPGHTSTLICLNSEWKAKSSSGGGDESICVPIQCGKPPKIEHGHYTRQKTPFKLGDSRTSDIYPFGTTLEPACELNYEINCTQQCGRINCGGEGTWLPKDGKFVTECTVGPLRSNFSKSFDDRSMGSETSLKHYLIITLAVICILIVGALTVLLLRRPTFCKKSRRGGNNGGTSLTGGANFNSNLLRGVDDTSGMMGSGSPIPPPLDSLPVAMNTGIFVPGGSYDWQECRFQEATLTGTAVFK